MDTDKSRHSANDSGAGNPRRLEACATRAGFTLVELLVALAIFFTVMSIVALLFTAAVRTTKQQAQNQEGFEIARGAMRLIERDLTRAFTNRDHGDVYSFYGTPIGFTFVGEVPLDDGSDEYNVARVTWVVYHDILNAEAGAVATYESTTGALVPTYALLRFVELGVDNLDAFPVPWGSDANLDDASPDTLEALVTFNKNSVFCPDANCDEIATQTARRDIWIRMLAGGDDEVQSAWSHPDMFIDLNPSDYFVAENLRFLQVKNVPCAANQSNLDDLLVDIEPPDFLFGGSFVAQNGNTCARVFGDFALDYPSWPTFVPNTTVAPLPNPNFGMQPYFTYWDLGTIRNSVTTLGDDKVTPLAFTFWNDMRNMIADGVDNDGDGLTDVGPDGSLNVAPNDFDEIYGINVGSPLDARLPRAVTFDFTLFFRSAYPGAPDFNQRFTQRIDLPTGYRRTNPSSAALP